MPNYELNLAASKSPNKHYADYHDAKAARMDTDSGEAEYDSDSYERERAIESAYAVPMTEMRSKRSDALIVNPLSVGHLPRELTVGHVSFDTGEFSRAIGSPVREILMYV